MAWENVPGAFSSNKGKDFQAVLTEIVRIADGQAPDVPMPDGGGKWVNAGCLYDYLGRWSVAWRVHDAQFWGVPQRRKRIALVADFGGLAAPEILFERESVSGDSESSATPREETTGSTGKGTDAAGTLDAGYYKGCGERSGLECEVVLMDAYRKTGHPRNAEEGQGWEPTNSADTLNAFDNSESRTPTIVYECHDMDARYKDLGDVCETVSAKYGTGGGNMPIVLKENPDDHVHGKTVF